MDTTKPRIEDLTVGQVGLVEVVEEMVGVLEELKRKADEPGAPKWHRMDKSEGLNQAIDAGLVSTTSIGMYTIYCVSKKGEELYTSLYP